MVLTTFQRSFLLKRNRRRDIAFFKAYAKLKLTGNYTDMDGLYYIPVIQQLGGRANVALSVGGDNYCYGNTAMYAYLNRAFESNILKRFFGVALLSRMSWQNLRFLKI